MNRTEDSLFDIYGLIIVTTILVVVYVSSTHLLTKPKIWLDEAYTIEQTHNLLRYGTPDIEIAPGVLSGVPYLIQSTGYPVKIPLAVVFKTFGYGFTQVRLYMLAWLITALLLVFYTAHTFFGKEKALFSFLLTATFASFYANGLTAVGEIPGFVFLLLGFLYMRKESYGITGLLWGLALVTKPSNFELIIPAIIIALLLQRTRALQNIGKVLCGMVPAVILWFIVVAHGAFTLKLFGDIRDFYINPYGAGASSSLNTAVNLHNFLQTPTLIYFTLLLVLVGIARFLISVHEESPQRAKVILLYDFTILYSVLAFLYYLRSPGWLRYILIAELLILFLLPHVAAVLSSRYIKDFKVGPMDWKNIWSASLTILICLQAVHFMTGAKIYYSESGLNTAAFLYAHFPNDSVAVYNSLTLAVLIRQKVRYQVLEDGVIPVSGMSSARTDPKPLSIQPPIGLVVLRNDWPLSPQEDKALKKAYSLVYDNNEYTAYRLKSLFVP